MDNISYDSTEGPEIFCRIMEEEDSDEEDEVDQEENTGQL